MTASPDQYSRPSGPAWWVHTDQRIVLAGPCDTEAEVRAEGNRVAVELRASMRREHYNERQIAIRVRALRVGYGHRSWPHGRFEATDRPPP